MGPVTSGEPISSSISRNRLNRVQTGCGSPSHSTTSAAPAASSGQGSSAAPARVTTTGWQCPGPRRTRCSAASADEQSTTPAPLRRLAVHG